MDDEWEKGGRFLIDSPVASPCCPSGVYVKDVNFFIVNLRVIDWLGFLRLIGKPGAIDPLETKRFPIVCENWR